MHVKHIASGDRVSCTGGRSTTNSPRKGLSTAVLGVGNSPVAESLFDPPAGAGVVPSAIARTSLVALHTLKRDIVDAATNTLGEIERECTLFMNRLCRAVLSMSFVRSRRDVLGDAETISGICKDYRRTQATFEALNSAIFRLSLKSKYLELDLKAKGLAEAADDFSETIRSIQTEADEKTSRVRNWYMRATASGDIAHRRGMIALLDGPMKSDVGLQLDGISDAVEQMMVHRCEKGRHIDGKVQSDVGSGGACVDDGRYKTGRKMIEKSSDLARVRAAYMEAKASVIQLGRVVSVSQFGDSMEQIEANLDRLSVVLGETLVSELGRLESLASAGRIALNEHRNDVAELARAMADYKVMLLDELGRHAQAAAPDARAVDLENRLRNLEACVRMTHASVGREPSADWPGEARTHHAEHGELADLEMRAHTRIRPALDHVHHQLDGLSMQLEPKSVVVDVGQLLAIEQAAREMEAKLTEAWRAARLELAMSGAGVDGAPKVAEAVDRKMVEAIKRVQTVLGRCAAHPARDTAHSSSHKDV